MPGFSITSSRDLDAHTRRGAKHDCTAIAVQPVVVRGLGLFWAVGMHAYSSALGVINLEQAHGSKGFNSFAGG